MMLSQSARTNFYCTALLPAVARELGCTAEYELFRVDCSLCVGASNGRAVPVIHVESENIASSATHEVRKLSCLAAPIKVLITCVDWRAEGKKLLNDWREIIFAQQEVLPRAEEYGFIVAEWDESLKFYSFALSSTLEQIEPEQLAFQRNVG
jgi:hypothetical protein